MKVNATVTLSLFLPLLIVSEVCHAGIFDFFRRPKAAAACSEALKASELPPEYGPVVPLEIPAFLSTRFSDDSKSLFSDYRVGQTLHVILFLEAETNKALLANMEEVRSLFKEVGINLLMGVSFAVNPPNVMLETKIRTAEDRDNFVLALANVDEGIIIKASAQLRN